MEKISKINDRKTDKNNNIIQMLRAFAIMLVLLHHSMSNVNLSVIGKSIYDIILYLHMPIFFIISGYFFELKIDKYLKRGTYCFLKNKARHLILPYVFWTILLYTGVQIACIVNIDFMTKIDFLPMSFWDMIKGLLTYKTYYTQHLWFLYVLFVMFLINILIPKFNKKIFLVISIILGILSSIITTPYILSKLIVWFPFFIIGRMIVENKDFVEKITSKKITIFTIIFIAFSTLQLVELGISNEIISNIFSRIIRYIISISGSYLIYVIANFIKVDSIKNVFSKIGDYSYEIYLIHNPYIVATISIVLNSILKVPAIICIIIAITMGIIIPILISKFIYRYLPKFSIIMFGK